MWDSQVSVQRTDANLGTNAVERNFREKGLTPVLGIAKWIPAPPTLASGVMPICRHMVFVSLSL